MAKLRLGLIGCGGMMCNNHVPSIDKLLSEGKNFVVTATCDIIKERADKVAKMYSAKSYTDYRDMLDDVDAVLIASTHDSHYEMTHFFMSNKKHCLLEKPLCNTREEVVDLIELSEKMDVTFMCAYPVPYWEGVCKMRELLKTGEYGKTITQMSIWTEQYTYCTASAKELGGGQLFSHGCHYMDILLEFLGDPECAVHMGTNVNTPWMEREGNSNVIMKFKNGAMAYHFGTWGARGTSLGYTFHIHTEEGMFDYDDTNATLKFTSNIHPDENKRREVTWPLGSTVGHATWREITHFLECVEEHKLPLTNGRRALRSLDMIWKIYEAEEKNEIADLSNI